MSDVSPALVQVIVDGAKRFASNVRQCLPIRGQRWQTPTASKHHGLWMLQAAHDDLTRALGKWSPADATGRIGTALAELAKTYERIRAYYGLDQLPIPTSPMGGPPPSVWWPGDWPPPEIDPALVEAFEAGIRRLDETLGIPEPDHAATDNNAGRDKDQSLNRLRAVLSRICSSKETPPMDWFLELGQVLHDLGMGHYTEQAVEGDHIEAKFAGWLLYGAARRVNPLVTEETKERVRDDEFVRAKLEEIKKTHRWPSVRGEFVKYSKRAIEEAERRSPETLSAVIASPASPTESFLEFPGKQRKLLAALEGQTNVPIRAVLQQVYGHTSSDRLEALDALKKRTNRKLAEKGSQFEIRKQGETLILALTTD
jgi:hypothetical protein